MSYFQKSFFNTSATSVAIYQNQMVIWNQSLVHIFTILFSWKLSFFDILLIDQVSILERFLSQDIKQFVFLNSS